MNIIGNLYTSTSNSSEENTQAYISSSYSIAGNKHLFRYEVICEYITLAKQILKELYRMEFFQVFL